MPDISSIISDIKQRTGQVFGNYCLNHVGGGSINDSYCLQAADTNYFIKLNQPQLASMFSAEAEGLAEMGALNCVRVPEVICHGQTDSHSYIVLEYIALTSLHSHASHLLGKELAHMHGFKQSFYGWHTDNTIGSTPQYNAKADNWSIFWQKNRLEKQLNFAKKNGYSGRIQDDGRNLIDSVPLFFTSYSPEPVLLHGDLWAGNAASDNVGNPVIFDPACYYGDRETDIAMTELFGGFGGGFFASYHAEYPLDPDYQVRKTLYNLYHILNHLNLFGSGYLSQTKAMMAQLLAEIS